MGLLQPHAGHGGCDGAARLSAQAPAIVVYDLSHALAALAAAEAMGRPVELWSAVGAAAYLGPLYWQKLTERAQAQHPKATFTAVLDCAERPGDVLAALRQGLRALCFTGREDVARKLREIAIAAGALLYSQRPEALDLRDITDPVSACRLWFGAANVENSPPLG